MNIHYEDWSIPFEDGTEATWRGEYVDNWGVLVPPIEPRNDRELGGFHTVVHRLDCPEGERS